MTDETGQRSGFAAVIGRPNAGKSTLVNRLVGARISIVTPLPGTTRHSVCGIVAHAGSQIILVDTPGLDIRSRKLLGKVMNRTVTAALAGADVSVMLVPATGWTPADDAVLGQVLAARRPVILAVTKMDLLRPRARLLPVLQDYAARADFSAVVPVSALRGENTAELLDAIVGHLPPGPPLYPPDMQTDRGSAFRVGEIIREKLMLALREELPYGVAVEIVSFEDRAAVGVVEAVIWVERESQKGIVVGQGGRLIKEIGTAARQELEAAFDKKFHLGLQVRLKRNWADSARALRQFGYEGQSQ